VEDALEGIRDVQALASGAVEGSREILALIVDAPGLIGPILVNAIACFIRRIGAVLEYKIAAVAAEVNVDLDAGAGGLAEAPLPAAAPLAVILVHRPRGGAHDRRGIDAAFEGPGGGHVNGHR